MGEMKIIISAMSKDRIIGDGSRMPWNIPEEFDQFLRFIEGQTVIMGKTSYQIFSNHLTSNYNIVISRSVRKLNGAVVCQSIEEAFEKAESLEKTIYIAGGGSIYKQTLDLADKMYLSYIKGDYEGDTYFPKFDHLQWIVEERKDHPEFEFVVYARK